MTDTELHSEHELLLQVAAGDEASLRTLIRQYAPLLNSYILQLTHQKEMAEEMVQDIFVQLWLTRETLGEIRHFRHYLFIIARNHTYDALKKTRRLEKRQGEWQNIQNGQDDPKEGAEIQLSLIDRAIEELPPQQQKVWILSRRQGKKYQEIAAEMNLSRETIKKYLQYATIFIRQYVLKRLDAWLLASILLQA